MAKVIKYCLVIGAILWLRDIIIKHGLFLSDLNHGFNNRFRNLWCRSPHNTAFPHPLKPKEFRLQTQKKKKTRFEICILLCYFSLFLLFGKVTSSLVPQPAGYLDAALRR